MLGQFELTEICERVVLELQETLEQHLQTENGLHLVTAYKRERLADHHVLNHRQVTLLYGWPLLL